MSSKNIYIVIGASKGLGYSLIKLAKTKGMTFGVARSIRDDEADDHVQINCDVSNLREIPSIMKRIDDQLPSEINRIYLFNNASTIQPIKPLAEVGITELKKSFDLNLLAPIIISGEFIKILQSRKFNHSTIVNISSGVSKKAIKGWGSYCITKAGLNMFTECIPVESNNKKIFSISINPGALDTDMQKEIRDGDASKFSVVTKFKEMYEMGELKNTDQVARKIFKLCDENNFINGSFIDFNNL